jgi:uncharacterized protein YmfQ (DUF2313 family)
VSLELKDIYFKTCIKIGGFVLGKLNGKHTPTWRCIKARFACTQQKGLTVKNVPNPTTSVKFDLMLLECSGYQICLVNKLQSGAGNVSIGDRIHHSEYQWKVQYKIRSSELH